MRTQPRRAEWARLRGLYAVTPEEADTDRLVDRVETAIAGGAAIVQYRSKAADAVRAEQAQALLRICRRRRVPLIVNDSAAVAASIDADGVHVGRADTTVARARALLGAGKIVGASCYDSLAAGRQAESDGADYVAFGSFFPSSVKPAAVRPPLSLITDAKRSLRIPVAAIGGVTVGNAQLLVDAGADLLAVITALFAAPDVYRAARAFSSLYAPSDPCHGKS